MKLTGNIRKMKSALTDLVQYQLPLYDILEPNLYIPLNELIGQNIRLTFENAIHCVVTGKKNKQSVWGGDELRCVYEFT